MNTINMALSVSTGTLAADFATPQDALNVARMVAAGCNVAKGFGCTLTSYLTGATLSVRGHNMLGMEQAISYALDALNQCHGKARTAGDYTSVTVPVTIAIGDQPLVEAEDWLRGVVHEAMQTAEGFAVRGEVVELGSARINYGG